MGAYTRHIAISHKSGAHNTLHDFSQSSHNRIAIEAIDRATMREAFDSWLPSHTSTCARETETNLRDADDRRDDRNALHQLQARL